MISHQFVLKIRIQILKSSSLTSDILYFLQWILDIRDPIIDPHRKQIRRKKEY